MNSMDIKKFSEVNVEDCKRHMRIEPDFTEDDQDIYDKLSTAKVLILDNAGFDIAFLDNYAVYSTTLLLHIVSELYHNRNMTAEKTQLHPLYQMMMSKVRAFNVE